VHREQYPDALIFWSHRGVVVVVVVVVVAAAATRAGPNDGRRCGRRPEVVQASLASARRAHRERLMFLCC
jgi:hypothetical protein